MKVSGIPFYPAHGSNYTRGRIKPIKHITVHHSAGLEQTLRYLWGDPNRNGSSHFWVGNGHIEQYVDTNDTAWTNGNWYSNNESITIEVRGDWRGYYDLATLQNLEKLLRILRKAYPNTTLTYHKDVSDKFTLCPADLKDKGYAKKEWDQVTKWLNDQANPTPVPTPPSAITYEPITPKRIRLTKNTYLWDFNFTDWSKAKKASPTLYPAGHLVDVVAVAKNALGGRYYMTAYSYNEGKIRATNGFNIVDAEDYKPVITQPPTVEPKWEPMDKPRILVTAQELRVFDIDNNKEIGDPIPKGTEVTFVEKKTLKNNRMYLRTQWSKTNNKNWGLPIDSLLEVEDVPREPVPEPPIDVDPEVPSDSDVVVATGMIEAIKKLLDQLLDLIIRRK